MQALGTLAIVVVKLIVLLNNKCEGVNGAGTRDVEMCQPRGKEPKVEDFDVSDSTAATSGLQEIHNPSNSFSARAI